MLSEVFSDQLVKKSADCSSHASDLMKNGGAVCLIGYGFLYGCELAGDAPDPCKQLGLIGI